MPKFKKNLPCKLTDREFEARAEAMALACEEYDQLEAKKKEISAELTESMKERRKEMQRLATVIENRREMRPVDCEWQPNEARKIMELVRFDTGEVVESRPMAPEEMQSSLDLQ